MPSRQGSPRPHPDVETGSVTSYLLIVLLSGLAWLCFFVLNRTKVHRSQPLSPPRRNTLYVSNHQSTVDTLLIALAACHPRCWLELRLLPWSLAADEVYFHTPVAAWFATRLRCIPVRRDRCDPTALRRMLRVLAKGATIYFPEGRRSRAGALLEAADAVGWIALFSGARVIPVAIDGTNEAVRFDRFGVRFFRRIGVSVGPELDLSAYRDCSPSRTAAREVTAVIMAAIERELVFARAARGSHDNGGRSPR